MPVSRISEILGHPKRDFIYDFLPLLKLNLCVDVGAAAGDITRQIRLAGGDDTQVVAYEPFPGNYEYFNRTTKDLDHVRLVKKALSDHIGSEEFIVHSVVQGEEAGWEDFSGYSSVGFLSSVPASEAPSFLVKTKRRIRAVLKEGLAVISGRSRGQVVNVITTTLDTEFPKEEIDFVKIDVQGAEAQLLRGASSALADHRIGILYIEWSGEKEIVDILDEHGYEIYDSTYITVPKTYDTQAFTEIGFRCTDEVNLSTGKTAYVMVLESDEITPIEAMKLVGDRDLAWMIQTDLVAVTPKLNKDFLSIAERLSDGKRPAA